VCSVWPREFAQYADFPTECVALHGSTAKRTAVLDAFGLPRDGEPLQVAVINYEATWRMPDAIQRFRPQMIVCDESHRIKQPTSKQSKCLHKLGAMADFRLILTGTPIQNNPLDFWSQYRFLDPSVFGTSFMRFRSRYAVMGGYSVNGKPVQIVGYRHLDELTDKAYTCATRVTKDECLSLPPQTFETRYVDLSPSERKMYRDMKRESIAWLGENAVTAQNVLSRLLILQRLTGGFVSLDDEDDVRQVGTSKLNALRDVIEDVIESGEKLVIFARFVAEIRAIADTCDKMGVRHADIWGEVKQEERGALVERFQTDPGCKVFIAQIDTAGLGITLTAAKVACFYSPTWNYASYQQALARTHRIGAEHHDSCHYIHLICPDTVDEDVMSALDQKKSLADLVVDRKGAILEGGTT
jgi:SNF2 family DNA or RNA helicase